MEEEFTLLEQQLIGQIKENLFYHLTQNAVFLAERLLAEKDNEYTRGILADCYLAENKAYKVFHILKDSLSQGNR